jgi:glycosyltransferase involved in cell wall biosynthesis
MCDIPYRRKETDRAILLMLGESAYTDLVLKIITNHYRKVIFIRTSNYPFLQVFTCRFYENKKKVNKLFQVKVYYPRKKVLRVAFLPITFIIRFFGITMLGFISKWYNHSVIDVCVAEGPENALLALFLKKLRVIDKVVYWAGDWFLFPSENVDFITFLNNVLNSCFDKFCFSKCNGVWNFTERIQRARQLRWKIKIPKSREKIVPPPFPVPINSTSLAQRKSIVFVGHPRKFHGLEIAINALAKASKEIPDLRLEIVGFSEYLHTLLDHARAIGVYDKIVLHNYVPPIRLREIMKNGLCGLAIFTNEKQNFSYFTIPSKVLHYLEAGMPVLTTRYHGVAELIISAGAGILVNCSSDSVSKAIIELAMNQNLFGSISLNAIRLARLYSSGEHLVKAINEVL